MDASPIDPAGCRWIWRDDEWRLMQGRDNRLGAVRRDDQRWMPYDASGRPIGFSYPRPPEARAHVERVLGIGHVMVSEHTTGG